jgi:hypothetical protein
MKRFYTLLFLSSAILFFAGCDKFKEKRFSTTIPYAFEVDITENGETTIGLTGELTSLINEELNKVKDDIKSYELVSITYKIWEYYPAGPNTFTGTIGFGNANSTQAGVTYTYNDIDLQAGNDNPSQVNMNLNSQDIERIQQYFLDTNGLKLYLNGSVTNKPVHFKLQVVVNIDAIAEVEK